MKTSYESLAAFALMECNVSEQDEPRARPPNRLSAGETATTIAILRMATFQIIIRSIDDECALFLDVE